MKAEPIRLGLIGAGTHATTVLLPLVPFLPARLIAVAEPDADRCRCAAERYGAAGYADAAQMIAGARLDAVLICVGERLHPSLVGQALDADLHVWVEKPLASTVAEIDSLIAKRRDRVMVVGYKKAFMPGIRRLRDLCSRTAAGAMLNLIGEYPVSLPQGGRAGMLAAKPDDWSARAWSVNGCHPLAAMLAIGGPVAHVTTHVNGRGYGVIALEFANGALGSLNAVPLRGVHDRYSVFCENLHAEVENGWSVRWHRGGAITDAWDFTSTGDHGGSVVWEPDNAFARCESRMHATQGFWHELEHFCACVQSGIPTSDGTLEFARDLQRAWDGALDSAGRRISL